jgi:xylan 1,4-beta-xylosidase
MESPQHPTPSQIKKLESAGYLETLGKPRRLNAKNGKVNLTLSLPPQGVSLLELTW